MRPAVRWISRARWEAAGRPPLSGHLDGWLGAGVRALWPAERAEALAEAVLAARAEWTADFGGEQFCLGRAFYTHLETGRSATYFEDAARSDARVEAALPGVQRELCALFGEVVGGRSRPRRGFCGPGAHVFPSGEKVAADGGVVHFDVEGLTPRHLEAERRALTLLLVLQPAERGGGLRLWDAVYQGDEAATDDDLARPSTVVRYRAGDALLIDSYRLHQIQPFRGDRARITLTVHAAEVNDGQWETWF